MHSDIMLGAGKYHPMHTCKDEEQRALKDIQCQMEHEFYHTIHKSISSIMRCRRIQNNCCIADTHAHTSKHIYFTTHKRTNGPNPST